jgi:hypothetical protein
MRREILVSLGILCVGYPLQLLAGVSRGLVSGTATARWAVTLFWGLLSVLVIQDEYAIDKINILFENRTRLIICHQFILYRTM